MSTFLAKTIERAKKDRKTIVLPESNDLRILTAASKAGDIANIILLGNPDTLKGDASKNGLDISHVTIIDPNNHENYEKLAEELFQLRKAKGMTIEQAREYIRKELYLGVMLVKMGMADGMVAGAANATADVLRPSLQILKTAPGTKLVSAFFIMCVPDCEYGEDGVFLYADSGLVENPDADDLSEIAISSAKSFETLVQADAKVAMLSYSSYGSAKSVLVDKVVEATRLAKEKRPDLTLDGELQVDAAIVPAVGKSKAPSSCLGGNANVLVFPDLNSGNIAYKLTERLAKAEAYGPITQGIAKPINDLSRGCSADDVVGVIAITAVQAGAKE